MPKRKIPRHTSSMCAATYWRLTELVRLQVGESRSALLETWINDKADEVGIPRPTNEEAHAMLEELLGLPSRRAHDDEIISQHFSF